MSRKIARITNDKELLLVNEIVEDNIKTNLSDSGRLDVNEIIEDSEFNIINNILTTSGFIEGCGFTPFWLDFNPIYDSKQILFKTNVEIIPYDCNIYMGTDSNVDLNYIWYKNNKGITCYSTTGKEWFSRTINVKSGDELYLYVGGFLTEAINSTMILRLNNAGGVKIAEFDFEIKPSCYLTTAMVDYFGKDDDGIELNSMRKLRSHSGYKYQDVLGEYYKISPYIINGIEQSGNKEYYYNMIKDVVDNIVIWVASEEWEKAEIAYLNLYNELKEKFGGDIIG